MDSGIQVSSMPFVIPLVEFSEVCSAEVMIDNLLGGVSVRCHHGGSDLTQTDAVPPSRTLQNELRDRTIGSPLPVHDECAAVEVRTRQPLPDFELFSHYDGA